MARDVVQGLASTPKYISSRYLYDGEGDRLFQQIMNLPEYYPTRCETEILETYRDELLQAVPHKQWDLVELGAGDGRKTHILLEHFLHRGARFSYFPIDISGEVLHHLQKKLQKSLPTLTVKPLNYEYFEALARLNEQDDLPRLILFLGGNIGNFKPVEARNFYSELYEALRPGDCILTGIDLRKNPLTILAAYNDAAGITRQFNLNVLRRFNRELGANFNPDLFQHYPTYDPVSGETLSYLMSTCEQEVYFKNLDQSFRFAPNEPIHTEISRKYSPEEIEKLAHETGFAVMRHFYDKRGWFTDTLWRKP